MEYKRILRDATILVMQDKVKKIMDSKNFGEQWEVGDEDKFYTVSLINKGTFSFFKCSCPHGSIHQQCNPECKHKESVRLFEHKKIWKR